MNEIEQRAFIRFLMAKLRQCRRELMVHRALAEELRLGSFQDVDAILDRFRSEPTLEEMLDRSLAHLEKLSPISERDLREKEFLEYLNKWEPDGEPN